MPTPAPTSSRRHAASWPESRHHQRNQRRGRDAEWGGRPIGPPFVRDRFRGDERDLRALRRGGQRAHAAVCRLPEGVGLSPTTLTVIFAVYVFGLIGSLLTVGALSDHIGRRPVLGAAIALEAFAFVAFLFAGNVVGLLVARVAQGIATGIAFSTLGATLVDLNPPHAPG